MIRRHRFSRPIRFLFATILCAAIAIWMAWENKVLDERSAPYNQRAFNAAVWRSASPTKDFTPRARMASDLTQRYLRVGLTKQAICTLLGPPERDETVSFLMPTGKQVDTLYEYDMGPTSMGMLDEHDLLRLYFDSGARCVLFQITKA